MTGLALALAWLAVKAIATIVALAYVLGVIVGLGNWLFGARD